MIERFQFSNNLTLKIFIALIIVVLSIGIIWYYRFNFGIDIAKSTRITITGAEADSVAMEINKSSRTERIESGVVNNQQSRRLYFLYLNEETKTNLTNLLKGKANIAYRFDEIEPSLKISSRDLAVVLIVFVVLTLVATVALLWHVVDLKEALIMALSNVDILFGVLLTIAATASILGKLGWQFSEFTFGAFIAIGLLVIIYELFVYLSWRGQVGEHTVANANDAFRNFVTANLYRHLQIAAGMIILLIPLLFLYDFTVEVLMMIEALLLTFVAMHFIAPVEVSFLMEKAGWRKKKSK